MAISDRPGSQVDCNARESLFFLCFSGSEQGWMLVLIAPGRTPEARTFRRRSTILLELFVPEKFKSSSRLGLVSWSHEILQCYSRTQTKRMRQSVPASPF